MGDLVGHDVGHPLELDPAGVLGVDEQGRLAEGDAAEVLHRPEREVGQGDQVELVGRVGDGEVVGEEPQGVGADLEREGAEALPARDARHPQRARRRRRPARS